MQLRPAGRAHTKGDQVITVPDAGIMFTGGLVETGQFAIFPWFRPYDTDMSGICWIEVMQQLSAARLEAVVPGHNEIDGCNCWPTSPSTSQNCAARPGSGRTRRQARRLSSTRSASC